MVTQHPATVIHFTFRTTIYYLSSKLRVCCYFRTMYMYTLIYGDGISLINVY